VTVAGRPARIERRAGTDARPILRLEGHGCREAAEALRGEPLHVPASALPELGEDEWWAYELEGCRVTDGEREIGVVRRMRALPSCEVLEVDRTGGGELLVPLVSDAVREVDVAGKRIDIDLAFVDPEDA
jgi:16S rRNA processing protein RimM